MEALLRLILNSAKDGAMSRELAASLLQMIQDGGNNHGDSASKDIAIIGVAAQFPGADSVEEFWANLEAGVDATRKFPEARMQDMVRYLHYTDYPEDQIGFAEGSFLENIDGFDYKFFRMSPKEASLMDPAMRLFLQTSWHVLENAGYGGKALAGTQTGVYVGYAGTIKDNYQKMILDVEPMSVPLSVASNLPAMIPSRIAYYLNLRGPTMVVDTACSSGLVTVHLACQGILNGDCDTAIAGAVKLHLLPLLGEEYKSGIESSDFRTRTFTDSTDGAGFGEGTAAVLLKPLSAALRDGDTIHAVIKGSAINNDGASNGITAPNPEAHTQLMVQAWEKSGISPESLSYIETHGTGTRLGDPIELEGIEKAFRKYTDRKQFCAISSVKPNIGHLYEAAGMANLIKAIMALRNRRLPKTLHFTTPNRYIPFLDSPVYVNTRSRYWEQGDTPRRCGVTSLGLSGTNAHVVLEEPPVYPAQVHAAAGNKPMLFTLSAKSQEALETLISSYIDFLEENQPVLEDLCFTASCGRGHFDYRLAVFAHSTADILDGLYGLTEGAPLAELQEKGISYGCCRVITAGRTAVPGEITEEEQQAVSQESEELLDELHRGGSRTAVLLKLARCYTSGAVVSWDRWYEGVNSKRMELPLYPFDNYRCWLEAGGKTAGGKQEQTQQPKSLFYRLEWRENPLSTATSGARTDTGSVLIVGGGDCERSASLVQAFRQQGRVVYEMDFGPFSKQQEFRYIAAPTEAAIGSFFETLCSNPPSLVVHMSTLTGVAVPAASLGELDAAYARGASSAYLIAKTIARLGWEQVDYLLVSRLAQAVDGSEPEIIPENASLYGVGKVIARELPQIHCLCLDLDDSSGIEQIMAELGYIQDGGFIAYRRGKRYGEYLRTLSVQESPERPLELKEKGVYIIAGGLGGIGLEIAKAMTAEQRVKLAFIGRSSLPERERWNEILDEGREAKVCARLEGIRLLEAQGASVEYFAAELQDEQAMTQIVNGLRERYGRINGVIHSAGIPGMELIIGKSEEEFNQISAPKVAGTWLLDHLTAGDALDFMILFSSVSTYFSAPGQVDYVAANAYMDSYAAHRSLKGKRTMVINWSTWKETGMACDTGFTADTLVKALPTKQGVNAFRQVFHTGLEQVAVFEFNPSMIHLLRLFPYQWDEQISAILHPDGAAEDKAVRSVKEAVPIRLVGREDGRYTEMEQTVGQIWGDTLGFTVLNIHDNYYELGGDSVLGIRIMNNLNKRLGILLSVNELFLHPMISGLASFLEEAKAAGEVAAKWSYPPIIPAPLMEQYPVSFTQKRMFVVDRMEGHNTHYNITRFLDIEGPLDIQRLEETFQALIHRHEALRTSFQLSPDGPVQIIHPTVAPEMGYEETTEDRVEALVSDFIRPFDLSEAPLLRIKILKFSPLKHLLLFDMHHIITDGVSMDILIRDLVACYERQPLEELKVQYKDYALWQNELAKGSLIAEQSAYWSNVFKGGIPVLELPLDYERPDSKRLEGRLLRFYLEEDQVKDIKRLAVDSDTTLFMVLLAAFNILLYRYSGQEDIVIGSPILGRPSSDLEAVVGAFINTLPMRNYPQPHKRLQDFLKEVRQTALEAYSHSDIPFDEIVDVLKVKRDPSRNPLFDVCFIFHNVGKSIIQTSDLILTLNDDIPTYVSKFDITLEVEEVKGKLKCSFEYASKLFSEATISRMKEDYVGLLESMRLNSNGRIDELELKSGRQMISSFGEELHVDFDF
ncbi:SDR family NAD(P)-dependent oxidoreductase [Paenibacillus sp. sgz5001063]|uniref:SDR family NAD(P)-dependent oxidoreductase n=1 Tax=Paenibacillus sp. sgz5001063 TaxID=3242474 RepID=UPI0036D26CB5